VSQESTTDQMGLEITEPTNQITSEHDAGSPVSVSDTCTTAEVRAGNPYRDSIRLRVAALVVACVLPVWVAAGLLLYYNFQSRQALTEQRMQETARALTMVVDRELASMQANLSALATTPSLVSGDLPAFYRQAQTALKPYPGADIILSDVTAQELIHTFLPFGVPLPKRAAPQTVRQVYETGKPVITGVYQGAGTRRLQIAVDVPVFRGARVLYDLAMIDSADRLTTVLLQQQLPPEWVGTIFDSNQVIVARTRLAEKFVGRQASPVLGQWMRGNAEGTAEFINFVGVPLVSSFSRSAVSGWTVMIGVPKAVMMAGTWRWLWLTIAGTALLSFTGIALAWRIGRSVERIERGAHRLGAIVESSDDAIIGYRLDGIVESWNRGAERLFGYSAPEIVGRHISILVPNDQLNAFSDRMRRVHNGKVIEQDRTTRKHKNGLPIPVALKISPIPDRLGTIVGASEIVRDITNLNKAEEALAESEERLRTIVELAPDAILVVSEQGQILEVNEAACKQFGYRRDQLLQLGILDIIAPQFAKRAAARLRGEVPSGTYENAHIRADGTEVPTELSVTKFMFRGQLVFLRITRDISDRKRAEEQREKLEQQLRQAQKMEAVGRLAGGIAHDFNNLLMVIQSYTELLQDKLPANSTFQKNTREIMKAAKRAASLTGQMLAFSRKQITSPVVLDLNAVIDETAKMLKRLIGEDIEFRVSLGRALWAIEADSDQMVQMLMNLCVNARDAMPQGGTLTIATGNFTVEKRGVAGRSYIAPGDYVWLSVTDTGTGINKDMQEQIFEPFFTTKEVGKGTGLGLAMVYGVVKQSGGYVWVDSELGQGACFTIYLPRTKGTIASAMSARAEARSQGTGTLLVAEDEESLREVMCEHLCSWGYTVLEASSGQQALSVASQHEGHIDLLITDLVMPKMSGKDLAQMLGSLRPDLKTIYMSGYTDDAVVRHGISELSVTFLQKPFSLDTLARKVRDTLGRPGTVQ